MGLLEGFLSGAASVGAELGMKSIQADIDEQKKERLLEMQKATQLDVEQKKISMNAAALDAARVSQKERIDTEHKGLIAEALKAKDAQTLNADVEDAMFGDDNGYDATQRPKATLTQDEQDRLRVRAGINTGDISPEKAGLLLNKEDEVTRKAERDKAWMDIKLSQLDSSERLATIKALNRVGKETAEPADWRTAKLFQAEYEKDHPGEKLTIDEARSMWRNSDKDYETTTEERDGKGKVIGTKTTRRASSGDEVPAKPGAAKKLTYDPKTGTFK